MARVECVPNVRASSRLAARTRAVPVIAGVYRHQTACGSCPVKATVMRAAIG